MRNHHNSLPELCTGALDKPQHLGAGLAVKVAGRLVGQHNSRFGNQGAGDSHTLLLSAGKIVRHIFQFIFQPQQMNDLVQKLLIHRVPVQLHRQDDVLIHIQDRNKVIVLEDKADVAAAEDGKLFVVLLCQFFVLGQSLLPLVGSVQPAHHVKQGGLAAAGGSHNGHKLTVIYGEVHAVKGAGDIRLCAVILFQINRLQNAHTQNSFQGFLPVDKVIVKPKCPRNVTAAKKFH